MSQRPPRQIWSGSRFRDHGACRYPLPSMDVGRVLAMAASIGAAVVLYAAPAQGAGDDWLAYEAPSVCASRAEFLAAVGARGARLPGPAASRTLEVSIRQATDGFAGSFQIRERDAVSGQRELRAAAVQRRHGRLGHRHGHRARRQSQRTAIPDSRRPPRIRREPGRRLHHVQPSRIASERPATCSPETCEVPAGTLRFQSLLTTMVTAGVVVGMIPSVVLPRYELTLFRGNFATTPNALTYLVGPLLHAARQLPGPGNVPGERWLHDEGQRLRVRGEWMPRAPLRHTRTHAARLHRIRGGRHAAQHQERGRHADSNPRASRWRQWGSTFEATYSLASRFFLAGKLGGEFSFSKLSANRARRNARFSSRSP